MKHLHILGINGTFMSGLAIVAREAGFFVTGNDENCYPPVSDLLAEKGIVWTQGYDNCDDALKADCVIAGNVMKRGMPVLEAVIEKGCNYTSGPQWLAENILPRYHVIAIAGTHGKTTTTSMIAWILHKAGLNPGFLIGGVAPGFNTCARLGSGKWFIIEADEYDSAFFDKRPKFMHYRPKIAVLNNLEFDHADIYADLAAIQQQFQYFLRTIPASGTIIKPGHDKALNDVLKKGCFSKIDDWAIAPDDASWVALPDDEACHAFTVSHQGEKAAKVDWQLLGKFNIENGLSAVIASAHAGVLPELSAAILADYKPVKRRLEIKSDQHGITVYDDFAHHPTAIAKTIDALKKSQRHRRLLIVMEFASYTMRSGIHADHMTQALALADIVYILKPSEFSLEENIRHLPGCCYMLATTRQIAEAVAIKAEKGDGVLIMSNKGFDHIHETIIQKINDKFGHGVGAMA